MIKMMFLLIDLLWRFCYNEKTFSFQIMFDEPKKKSTGGDGDEDDQKKQEDKGGAEAGEYYQDTRIGEGHPPEEDAVT